MKRKRGQSILEYVIVLTAIIAAIAVGVTQFANKDEEAPKGVGKLMQEAGDTIEAASGNILEQTQ